jgi:hypothetical protein
MKQKYHLSMLMNLMNEMEVPLQNPYEPDETEVPLPSQPVPERRGAQPVMDNELTVCSICGCTPCEWQQYGLNAITLVMQAFDHDNRSADGQLILLVFSQLLMQLLDK